MAFKFSFFLAPLLLALILALNTHSLGDQNSDTFQETDQKVNDQELKTQAFEILKTKCNSCHKKKNPFMIFSLRNMEKRASKIQTQVFELKRMPKSPEVTLTEKEKTTLKNWLITTLTQK